MGGATGFPVTVWFDDTTRLAEAMTVLGFEIDDCYGMPIHSSLGGGLFLPVNSGELGNAAHAVTRSRHNRAKCPDGIDRVCAIDVSGPASTYQALAEFHRACWLARLVRIYRFGFSQRGDSRGLSWSTGAWYWTGRDQGHCHFDITMRTSSITVTGDFVPAWLDTSRWYLREFLATGRLPAAAYTPTSSNGTPVEDGMSDADVKKIIAAFDARIAPLATATSAAADMATRAVRLGQVLTRARPPAPNELLPALPPGVAEPTWRRVLEPGAQLLRGEYLWSADSANAFGLRADGLLVGYRGNAVVFHPGERFGVRLAFQTDGQLVLYDVAGKPVWFAGTAGVGAGGSIVCQPDGNTVLYVAGRAVWSAFTDLIR